MPQQILLQYRRAEFSYLGQGISGQFYYDHIVPAIEDWSQHLSKWEVAKQLTEIGFSMGVVQNQSDLDQCPQLIARNMIVDGGDMLGGSFRMVRTPIQLTACVDPPVVTPPTVGQHNQEVLCGIGGLTPEDLSKLQADGVV